MANELRYVVYARRGRSLIQMPIGPGNTSDGKASPLIGWYDVLAALVVQASDSISIIECTRMVGAMQTLNYVISWLRETQKAHGYRFPHS